jgi:hypothetical protein
MKRRAALTVIAALLAACGSSAAHSSVGSGAQTSAAGSSTGSTGTLACGPSHAKTLGSSSQARVYASHGSVFGCARGSRSFLIGQSGTCLGGHARIVPVAVTGVLAAYGSERCGVDTGSSTVLVQRLSTGAVLSQQAASSTSAGAESYTMVSAIVLARDGAVAWISVSNSIVGGRHISQVHALDRHGLRVLDQGRAIDSARLRLQGSTVSWKHAGHWRSAKLA